MSPYSPIDSEGREIRLLELLPAESPSSPLECKLHPVCLASNPPPAYEALSYTWGGPAETGSPHVTLNGVALPILENLDAVLRRLRPRGRGESRILWIDALCIDQSSLAERAAQVKLMRDVYDTAARVLLWLGEPAPGSELGLVRLALDQLASRAAGARYHEAVELGVLGREAGAGSSLRSSFSLSQHRLRMEREKDEIRELLCRPWWSRVWIVQEAVVARTLRVLCGEWEFEWERLADAREEDVVSKQYGFTRILHPELASFADNSFDDLAGMRARWARKDTEAGGNNLYRLLYDLRRLACTDPRDRIFAFLGLVPADMGNIFRPDYSRPVAETYTEYCRAVIAKTGSLDILNCVREWRGAPRPVSTARVYSLYARASYHDLAAAVQYEGEKEATEGAAALPRGWERCFADGKVTFFDHNTQTRHNESPLAGKVCQPSGRLARQQTPEGCKKVWDNVGRASIRFNAPASEETPIFNAADDENFAHLPSWAPNFAARSPHDPEPLLDWANNNSPTDSPGTFRAAGSSIASSTSAATADNNINTLSLAGVTFDTIAELADPWHPTSDVPPLSSAGIPVLASWRRLALRAPTTTTTTTSPCPYGGPSGRAEALWRTHLLADAPSPPPPPRAADQGSRIFVELFYDEAGWASRVRREPASELKASGPPNDVLDAGRFVYEAWRSLNGRRSWVNRALAVRDVWAVEREYLPYLRRIFAACAHRRLLVTRKGYVGLAPWNAAVGDKVVILEGGRTPFLLRGNKGGNGTEEAEEKEEEEGGSRYGFVGECYVHGIMGGEAWEGQAEGPLETFHIR
ncbi:HET-domain-containing protein [Xylariomycetidae sp. FL2044]|nr:HET-domain-containing protein [Xylariomycetidae sp. FL2044]